MIHILSNNIVKWIKFQYHSWVFILLDYSCTYLILQNYKYCLFDCSIARRDVILTKCLRWENYPDYNTRQTTSWFSFWLEYLNMPRATIFILFCFCISFQFLKGRQDKVLLRIIYRKWNDFISKRTKEDILQLGCSGQTWGRARN